MAAVVDKTAFPPERLKVEAERVRTMSQDVSKRKKSAAHAQRRAKKSETKTRDEFAKRAARRRRESAQEDRQRKAVARQKVVKASDKQKKMKGEGWQVSVYSRPRTSLLYLA